MDFPTSRFLIISHDYAKTFPFEGDLPTPCSHKADGGQKPCSTETTEALVEAMATQSLSIHSPDYCIHSPAKYIHENP